MTIQYRFVVRRRLAANWTSLNEVLLSGEYGLETDTRRLKIGDGVTAWNSLPYIINDVLLALADLDLSGQALKFVQANATEDGFQFGTASAPAVSDSGGGSVLVAAATVTGSAQTSLTVSGLSLAADGAYRVRLRLKNATATDGYCYMFANGNTTAGNYDVQVSRWIDTGGGGARFNDAHICYLYGSSTTAGFMDVIADLDNKPEFHAHTMAGANGAVTSWDTYVRYRTAGDLTSLTLTASVANALAIGTSIEVWTV